MFTPETTRLDLDFELSNDRTRSNGTMTREFLSSPSPSSSSSTYRLVKAVNNNKRTSDVQLGRQLTDDGSSKQRTPPNSLGNSVSPLSSSYLSRLSSSHENSPNRLSNVPQRSSTQTSVRKTTDPLSSMLKQAIAPTQLIQAVQTRLENPTRYHLEQISRKHTLTNIDEPSGIFQVEESSPDSEITSEMDEQFHDETTCASVESNSRAINITGRTSDATTPTSFLSSSLSKERSDSLSCHSSSCPTNILTAKAKIGLPLTEDEMRLVIRDRQKKDNHNMIERRRRFNINDRIKELGTLLPKGTDSDAKHNKGTILRASVDYIRELRRQHENVSVIEEKFQLLTEENQSLHERIRELERQCLVNGIPISPTTKSSTAVNIQPNNSVKQEPSSLSSSLTNPTVPLVPPSTPIFSSKFDSFPNFDSFADFSLGDDDSNETRTASEDPIINAQVDPLAFTTDPFLSSTSFYDQDMDLGGAFP